MPAALASRPSRLRPPRSRRVPERARRATRAPQRVVLARGSPSPEARVPGHRRSGSAAIRESAARAAAKKPFAIAQSSCAGSAAVCARRLEEIAWLADWMAVSARRRNVGSERDGPQPMAPAGPISPQVLALPLHAPRCQLQAAGSQAGLPAPTACRRLNSADATDGEQLLRSCSMQIPHTRALIDTHVTHALCSGCHRHEQSEYHLHSARSGHDRTISD